MEQLAKISLDAKSSEPTAPTVLITEEAEAVIAPKLSANHNEIFLTMEEAEAIIAPKLSANHNETFLS